MNSFIPAQDKKLEEKNTGVFLSKKLEDDLRKSIRRFKNTIQEPFWEKNLRKSTNFFKKKLVHLEFSSMPHSPTFLIGNNIDFCKWAIVAPVVKITDSASVYAEQFKQLREKLFEFRENLLVSGIFVRESVPHERAVFHEQIVSVFERDRVSLFFDSILISRFSSIANTTRTSFWLFHTTRSTWKAFWRLAALASCTTTQQNPQAF